MPFVSYPCTDMEMVSYLIRVRGYIILKKTYICGTQWILDIGYDIGMSTWAKMKYSYNLDHILYHFLEHIHHRNVTFVI
jgi:hypothetical protein